MKYNYETLKDKYEELLSSVEIKAAWAPRVKAKARRIYANRDRYKALSATIPWQFIGVIHSLESDLDFNTHLHNGDPLTSRTRHVPKGRPLGEPPFTWEESALDALEMKGYHRIKDWSMAHQCYLLEMYNGFGYQPKKINSPYLWSGTNQYERGKYVSDGVFSSTEVSGQIGCVPLLLELQKMDEMRPVELATESRKVSILTRIRTFFGVTVAGWFSLDNLPAAQQIAGMVKEFAINNAAILMLGSVGVVWFACKYLEFLHLEDYKNGAYTPSRTFKIPAADPPKDE